LLETAQRIAPAIKEAKDNLGPVEMGVASGKIPNLNYNRRRDPVVDDEMVVATFARPGGELVAVFVNFTAHPTITGSRNMLLSGEWPGYMARAIQAQLGDELPVLYMNGPQGDQAPQVPRDPGKTGFQRVESYGTAVAEKALELLATVTTQPIDRLHLEFASIKLPETKLSPMFAMIAGTEYRVKPDELELGLAGFIPSEAEVGLLVVGDLLLVGIPGEPIAAIGLEIERRARELGFKHPAAIGLANDYIGYVLTPEEYAQGGYEATVSFFGPDLGTVIVSKTAAALQSL
jgi:neutral ceramidase